MARVAVRNRCIGAPHVMIGSRLTILATLAVVASAGFSAPAHSESMHPIIDAIAVTIDSTRPRVDDRATLQSSHRTSNALLQAVLRKLRADPEWLVRGTGVTPLDHPHRAGSGFTYVALQIDRLDGMDLLTVRRSLKSLGNLQLYAGAGLGRAKYLDDDALAKPLPRRRAQHSLGTAAEVGARAQLSERVSVDAALRWTKLAGDVALLQSNSGLTSADAVMLGVTVAYRFR